MQTKPNPHNPRSLDAATLGELCAMLRADPYARAPALEIADRLGAWPSEDPETNEAKQLADRALSRT